MNTEKRPVMVMCAALIKAISVIDKLPPERQEKSNRDDMFLILQALLQNKYPGEKGTVTGRDVWIVCNALSYAIAVEHPDKELMQDLLEETSGDIAWTEFHMANADRHIHGWGFGQKTKH